MRENSYGDREISGIDPGVGKKEEGEEYYKKGKATIAMRGEDLEERPMMVEEKMEEINRRRQGEEQDQARRIERLIFE